MTTACAADLLAHHRRALDALDALDALARSLPGEDESLDDWAGDVLPILAENIGDQFEGISRAFGEWAIPEPVRLALVAATMQAGGPPPLWECRESTAHAQMQAAVQRIAAAWRQIEAGARNAAHTRADEIADSIAVLAIRFPRFDAAAVRGALEREAALALAAGPSEAVGVAQSAPVQAEAANAATPPADHDDLVKTLDAIDPTAKEALAVAKSDASADVRMRQLCGIDYRYRGYNSNQWANVPGVTANAVRKTPTWKAIRSQMQD